MVSSVAETIRVLALDGAAYVEHGLFRRGEHAASKIIGGFRVDVDEVFGQ
jgi:hypothetical protein